MTDCVVDASVIVLAVGDKGAAGDRLRERLVSAGSAARHAPHLVDAEVGSVLRRQHAAGRLSEPEAVKALATAATLIDRRYGHTGPLARVAWTLRDNLSFCDALYVALASALDLPLLTADARLVNAPALPCAVELV